MKEKNNGFEKGTYGYDVALLEENNIETVELSVNGSDAKVLIAPGYQGRVMTTSSKGSRGKSFGWINYKFIQSGVVSNQFNPVGGEERFWFGPEGNHAGSRMEAWGQVSAAKIRYLFGCLLVPDRTSCQISQTSFMAGVGGKISSKTEL